MKTSIKTLILLALGALVLSFPPKALAATPYLSLSNSSGDNMTVSVSNADPYAPVQLFYTVSGSQLPTQISNFGTTSGNGYFSTVISGSAYGLNSSTRIYVTVNGQQSNNVSLSGSGCNYAGCYVGGLTLSPNSLSLNAGQSATVYLSGGVNMSAYPPYVSANSNPATASVSLNNSYLTVTGNTAGSATITVCLSGGSTCGSVYVTVSGNSNNNNQISFSQNNVNLNVGQSQNVTVYSNQYYGNNFYVSSNSNPNAVMASISGSTLSLYGQSSGNGSIIVCSNNSSQCGSIYVAVSGSSGQVSFSQSNVSLNTGQNQTVGIYNSLSMTGYSYYISSNSNSSAVSASVSGSTLHLQGLTSGSSTINVCMTGFSYCGSVYVTVSGGSSLSLSQTSLNLNANQSGTVSIYGSGSYYVSGNSNSNVATASVSGSTLNVYGNSSGSTSFTVCQYSYSSCVTLYVTVAGGSGTLWLSQSSVTVNQGQNISLSISGNYSAPNYYVSSNSNSNAVSASVSGSNLNLYGNNAGFSTVTVCQSGYSGCASVNVTVAGYAVSSLTFTTTSLPQPVMGQYYSFQLAVSGGTLPYSYSIINGSLPLGLSLSSGGLIFGTPQNNAGAAFSVRVSDNFGRTGQTGFTLTPSGVLGAGIFSNGALINEGGTVYLTYRNTKSGFASASVFRDLGYKFSSVAQASGLSLPDSGYIISSSQARHPWGAWVKSGRTVYFVHEMGLLPVPSEDVFFSNGGSWDLVVPANRYDFQLPMLSAMTLNDSRLR